MTFPRTANSGHWRAQHTCKYISWCLFGGIIFLLVIAPPHSPANTTVGVPLTPKAANIGDYLFQWGGSGSGDGSFGYPEGVAINASGDVYVGDYANDLVQVFTTTGQFLNQWSLNSYPWGVAVNGSGAVYVAEPSTNCIQVFTQTGQFITQWGSSGSGNGLFNEPVGVAVNASGFVYVTDAGNDLVQVFTQSGQFVTQWGGYGSGYGLFNVPTGIAVNGSGYIYITDTYNCIVQVFNQTGQFVTQWGSYGTGVSQFVYIRYLAVDRSGRVYVTDSYYPNGYFTDIYDDDRVEVFTQTGQYLTQWGTYGSGNGDFYGPSGIAVNGSGVVYVADMNNNRVQIFDGYPPVATIISVSPAKIDKNNSSSLTSIVGGGVPLYTYQWLQEAPGAGSFSPIEGATSNSYTFTPTTDTATGAWQFELQVTDSDFTVNISLPQTVMVTLVAPFVTASLNAISQGQSTVLSSSDVTTGTPPYTYQWFAEDPGSTSYSLLSLNGTSQSYTFWSTTDNSTGSWSFILQVADSAGASAAVNATPVSLILAAEGALVVPTFTSTSTVDQGQSAILSSNANGGKAPYSYQWLQEAPGAGCFSPIGGATYDSYTFATTNGTVNGAWQFELQATDDNSIIATSEPLAVTVNAQLVAPTASVTSGTIDVGQSTTITNGTIMTNGTTPYSYQWLNSTSSGGPYSAIPGATATNYLFVPWDVGTWYFELNVTDGAGVPVTVTSNSVPVTVNTQLVAPTVSVNYNTIDLGQSALLSSTTVGTGTSPYTYQWLNSTSLGGPYTAIPGATGTTYTFASWSSGTWYFELAVTDSAGVNVTVTSNAVPVIVNTQLVATASVNYGEIDLGQSSLLSYISAGTGTPPYTYQWLNSTTIGGPYTAIPGATGITYTFTSWSTGKWYFELNVTDSAGINVTETSNAVAVIVNSPLSAPTVSANHGTIAFGETATLSDATIVTTGSAPYAYQWLNSTSSSGPYIPIPGATGSTYAFTPWTTGTWYFEQNITDNTSVPETVTSNAVSVIVTPIAPSAPQSLTNTTNAGFDYIQLSWSPPASDGGASITQYRIYRGTSSGGETYYANTSSTSYTDNSIARATTYYYLVYAENLAGTGPASNEAHMYVNPTVPGAPQSLKVTAIAGAGHIELSWSAPASDGGALVTLYVIYRGTSSGHETLYQYTFTLGFEDRNVTSGTTYYYTVYAINSAGTGPASNEANATYSDSTSANNGAIIAIVAAVVAIGSTFAVVVVWRKNKERKRSRMIRRVARPSAKSSARPLAKSATRPSAKSAAPQIRVTEKDVQYPVDINKLSGEWEIDPKTTFYRKKKKRVKNGSPKDST